MTTAGTRRGHHAQALEPGQRVRLRPPLIEIELSASEGIVVGPDPKLEGYFLVRLDAPAKYWPLGVGNPLGLPEGDRWEPLPEVSETPDNVDIFDGGGWVEPAWVCDPTALPASAERLSIE